MAPRHVSRVPPLLGGLALAAAFPLGGPAAASQELERLSLELPAVFGDGMVLQRGANIPVWGRAEAREQVEVKLFTTAGGVLCTAHATAADSGAWRVGLDLLLAPGPYRLEVRGEGDAGRVRAFEDVLVGEVWLGSGQSNMHMTVSGCRGHEAERAGAKLPELRMFLEKSQPSPERQWRGEGRWVRCDPETYGDFSAVLYWFGKELQAELGVPVGLIDASVGGSRIELWTSPAPQFASTVLGPYVTWREGEFWGFDTAAYREGFLRLRAEWEAHAVHASALGEDLPAPPRNANETRLRHGGVGHLFHGKIAPLAPYGLRGFLWYQGEDNTRHAELYGAQLELLVADWRAHWGRGDLPFAWVQLPNFYDGRPGADWPRIREEMRRSLCIPNTGMVVTLDLGLRYNIHPPDKATVAHRLAGWALSEVYARPRAWSSAQYTGHVSRGGTVTVSFFPTYGRLAPIDRDLRHFELAGSDGIWHTARARVPGDAPEHVIVECEAVPEPCDVRYAWQSDLVVELVNAASLPVGPFTSKL